MGVLFERLKYMYLWISRAIAIQLPRTIFSAEFSVRFEAGGREGQAGGHREQKVVGECFVRLERIKDIISYSNLFIGYKLKIIKRIHLYKFSSLDLVSYLKINSFWYMVTKIPSYFTRN